MRLRTHGKPTPEWERMFLLIPRKIGNTWIWLETVERKLFVTWGGGFYDYRTLR